MDKEPLLKPMPRDALTRRAAAPAAPAEPPSPPPLLSEKPKDPPMLRRPEFAPFPAARAEAPALDELLTPFLSPQEEEEPDTDAVPTRLMPVPVCVPLFEEPQPRRRRSRRQK